MSLSFKYIKAYNNDKSIGYCVIMATFDSNMRNKIKSNIVTIKAFKGDMLPYSVESMITALDAKEQIKYASNPVKIKAIYNAYKFTLANGYLPIVFKDGYVVVDNKEKTKMHMPILVDKGYAMPSVSSL